MNMTNSYNDPVKLQLDYQAVIDGVDNACPVTDENGTRVHNQNKFSSQAIQGAIKRALVDPGASVQDIVNLIVDSFRPYFNRTGTWNQAWSLGTGEFFSASIKAAFPTSGPHPQRGSPFDILAEAFNGANINEAENGHAFMGLDGRVHRIEEASYGASRDFLLTSYYATHAPPTP
jgi:hypothetical protein